MALGEWELKGIKPKVLINQKLSKPHLKVQEVKSKTSSTNLKGPIKQWVPKFEIVDMLKKICINNPFAEALSQMPLYAKFLKDIFSKKRKIEHTETIALTKEGSAIIKKLPPKLRGPGSFSIPCVIESETIDKAMCDLRASVSLLPLSLFKRIGIGELKPTEMALKLADRNTVDPVGFVEEIPVNIERIYIPAYFMVVDIDEDPQVPILLRRPFIDKRSWK